MHTSRKTSSSSLKQHSQQLVPSYRGPAITTNIDARDSSNVRFQHEVKHEKTIEAVITNYPGVAPPTALPHETSTIDRSVVMHKNYSNGSPAAVLPMSEMHHSSSSYQQLTRNKRISTEVLGSSLESTKTSQRAPNGHRRVTTHIVRKVTTLSRAEEDQQPAEQLLPPAKMLRSSEIEYRRALPTIEAPSAVHTSSLKRTKVKIRGKREKI